MTRYGCHSQEVGPGPRGGTRTTSAPDGWTEDGRRKLKRVTTDWNVIQCGIQPQAGKGPDPHCKDCENGR